MAAHYFLALHAHHSQWLGLWAVHRTHTNACLSSFPLPRHSTNAPSYLWALGCPGYHSSAIGSAVPHTFPSLARVSPLGISTADIISCQVPLHCYSSQDRISLCSHLYAKLSCSITLHHACVPFAKDRARQSPLCHCVSFPSGRNVSEFL